MKPWLALTRMCAYLLPCRYEGYTGDGSGVWPGSSDAGRASPRRQRDDRLIESASSRAAGRLLEADVLTSPDNAVLRKAATRAAGWGLEQLAQTVLLEGLRTRVAEIQLDASFVPAG